jgi:thioredoxin-related protein
MFLNENFISTIYDPEILVNHFRLTNWGVTSVPTCLFFTPSGKKVQAINGYLDKDQFLQIAMETLANMQENHPANVEPDPTDTEAKDTTKAGTAPMEQGSTIAEPQADSTTSKN